MEPAQEPHKNEEEDDVKEEKVQDDDEQQAEGVEDNQQCVKDEGGQEMEKQPDSPENVPASDVAMETGDAKSDVPPADAAEEVTQERAEVEPDQQESAPRDNGQAERMEASEERPGQSSLMIYLCECIVTWCTELYFSKSTT